MKVDEIYELKSATTRKIFMLMGAGVIALILGIVMNLGSGEDHGHGDAEHAKVEHADSGVGAHDVASADGEEAAHGEVEEAHAGHHAAKPFWLRRLIANLWLVSVYFIGISVIGVFFVAIQYVAQAGWMTALLRIPLAFGHWIGIGGIILIILFFAGKDVLFHWSHEDLYVVGSETYDKIMAGKAWFLGTWKFLIFTILFIGAWVFLYMRIRLRSLNEDEVGGVENHKKLYRLSAIFLLVFAVSSSIASWYWVMSIDAHWFSTLFGWYMFASWFVAGLCMMTYIAIKLKEAGYLSFVTMNHLHDLGKFIFGFSIFWTYLWFSQFFLYWYADLPEEVVYFKFRFDNFKAIFFVNLFINFVFPFMALMTRDAKRTTIFLKVVCVTLIFGHWLDFYLMIMPGTMKTEAGFGLIEFGALTLFLGGFLFVTLRTLSKANLVAKKHPMLDESLHHHT